MRAQRVCGIALVAVWLIGGRPVAAQDTIELPDPTGTYAVGRTDYDLVDQSRDEIFTDDPADKREILLSVYYPVAPAADAETAPYMTETLRQAIARQDPSPIDEVAITSHAYRDQPVAKGVYPALIFLPGFGYPPVYYTSLLEEVASHGYVIAAVWPLYSAAAVEFPDGRIVLANEAGGKSDAMFEVWKGDARFALDSLETFNREDGRFAGHLDLEHVGAFGHSFGGGTAGEFAYHDERVDAAISMDGGLFGESYLNGLAKPLLMMHSDVDLLVDLTSDEEFAAAQMTREGFEQQLAEGHAYEVRLMQIAHPGYDFTLKGSLHDAYTTDLLAVAVADGTLVDTKQIGTIDPRLAFELIRSYVVAFLDQGLKGTAGSLLQQPRSDSRVSFEIYNAD
ncbi:MAG TPA: hypothetical protein VH482_19465 [Thermomicrobiales bacterium]|jgi:dienelactone hydrolase